MSKNSPEEFSFEQRKQLASKVKDLRQRAGLKQDDLAELAEISRQAVSNIERGATPQLKTLRKVYEVLGAELEPARHADDTNVWLGIIGGMLDTLEAERRAEAGTAAVNAVATVIATPNVGGSTETDVPATQSDYTLAAKKRSKNRGETTDG